ncbi:unnamed protein product, partial [Iphiclides podalirius]
MNQDITTILVYVDQDILALIAISLLTPVLLMEILVQMALLVLLFNKADINVNVYLDGKDNYVKLIQMIVLKNRAFLELLAQI